MSKRTVASLQSEWFVPSLFELVDPALPVDDRLTEAFLLPNGGTQAFGAAFGTGYDDSAAVITVHTTDGDIFNLQELVWRMDQFILSSISETEIERSAPIYTFGAPVVYTTNGTQPKIFTYQGHLLINTLNDDSRTKFLNFYEKYARATAAITGPERREKPYVVTLTYRNRTVMGVLVSIDVPETAVAPNIVPVIFSMFVYHANDL